MRELSIKLEAEKTQLRLQQEAAHERVEFERSAEQRKAQELERAAAEAAQAERAELRRRSRLAQDLADEQAAQARAHAEALAAIEEQRMQREADLQQLRIQAAQAMQAAQQGGNDDQEGARPGVRYKASRPKLPMFNEDKDDIDSYLQRYEQVATANAWPAADWSIHLSTLLAGKALETYARSPPDTTRDYQALKIALLRRYDCTAEGFRKRFHEARREPDETATVYLNRSQRYFNRWVDMSNINKTYDDLLQLIIKDQFVTTCEPQLSIYIKERELNSIAEVAKAADNFLEARRYTRPRDESKTSKANSSTRSHGTGHSGASTSRQSSQAEPRVCFTCKKPGHFSRDCRSRPSQPRTQTFARSNHANACLVDEDATTVQEVGDTPVTLSLAGCSTSDHPTNLFIRSGTLGGRAITVMRDTGCTGAVVRRSLVAPRQMTDRVKQYRMIDGTLRTAPIAHVHIKSPYFTGELEAICVDRPLCDVIIGNIAGAEPERVDVACQTEPDVEAHAVATRAQTAQATAATRALSTFPQIDASLTRDELVAAQRADATLIRPFKQAAKGRPVQYDRGGKARYEVVDGLLRRIYSNASGHEVKQLVVPGPLRPKVLALAHDAIMTGHLGIKKTSDRVLANFFWPGLVGDVTRYCRSCVICQHTIPKGRVSVAPLQKMPIIGVPFQRVAMDLIGPIEPMSTKKNRFILTVIDYATRYPEAVALPSVDAIHVAEALCKIYSRVGIPEEILSDQGAQFMSKVMAEVSRLLSVTHLTSTPYHPQCNGLCEKFNGTLKHMLKKLCAEKPKDWDRYIEAVLFAYREVPQESLKFSPFELLYGRTVRGPMTILRQLWTKENTDEEVKTTYQYVVDLRNQLEDTCRLAQDALRQAQEKGKRHFDRKAKMRSLEVGSDALVLLPTANNKLMMHWRGPYRVVDRVSATDYKIDFDGKVKVYHINMLKQFVTRNTPDQVATTVLEETDDEDMDDESHARPELCETLQVEHWHDAKIDDALDDSQQRQTQTLLHEYADILSDVPGQTNLAEHKIQLNREEPVRVKPYPLPYNVRKDVEKEVKQMIELNVIEPSVSPYSSPLHLVKKKDGTYRPVIDFRKLNKVTVFDVEPMPNPNEIFSKLAGKRYFSKLDFTKGYWQIPMAEEDKHKTCFTCTLGSFQFRRMPFGLVNSGAAYNRMMRRLLDGVSDVDSFVDDVLIHSYTWDQHVKTLREVFERIRAAGLTIKPSKCSFGHSSVEFVGHHVGNSTLQVVPGKIEQMMKVEKPRTKKQLRSFLGATGYYRSFVPNYAAIAVALTDATAKLRPNELVWSEAMDRAYEKLKTALSTTPILQLPDWDKTFVLRTDASDEGIGAVLLQEHDSILKPVSYSSKKLLPRERRYSTIERECLGIVWAVDKFQVYLYGKEFILQCDHKPLAFMDQAKFANARVMRWALALQPYRYNLQAIPGTENVGADFMSRNAL